jgi:tetratricopeptide (TPR) repeat protein
VRGGASAAFLAALFVVPAGVDAEAPAVRVWEATETIPTYEEGPPDVNPPFDLFASTRFNYPYTLREGLTDRRAPRVWRTLNLENEHLRVSVLPDLGGRLWRCIDKANGASMFYANPSLKFAHVAYRGVWATFGIEFNFPVSHNWVTSSPVDFATRQNPDGSADVVVGNVDLVYGMQWRVELRLRPGRGVLEQTTTLYNRSDLRHRFYWWTNAAVEAWDDSRLVYPMDLTASHGFTQVDTWPIDTEGVDLSRPGNHLKGPVSLFSHGSREPFMGVYHPRTRAGVAHWSDPAELPAKKVWSWGADADGRDWRKALSDNDSAEVEIQAGLFRNQETYAFLLPQEVVRFREYWLPVREIGGFVRATPDAVLNLERVKEKAGEALVVGLNVTRTVRGGRLRVKDGERVLSEDPLDLTPADAFRKRHTGLPRAERYTVEVVDGAGGLLLAHTEGRYDNVPRSEVAVGPQPAYRFPPPEARGEGDFVELGTQQEREGKLLRAYETYEDGLRRFPASFALTKAAGRLGVALKRYEEAAGRLETAAGRVSNDADIHYHLGVARLFLGERVKARSHWELAIHDRSWRSAALLQLARLAAQDGDVPRALGQIDAALRAGVVRAFEVILRRRSGARQEAGDRLAFWLAEDPTNATLRNEAVKLGQTEDARALWRHLAGDPQRVLEAALDYMALGAWDDAVELLSREYPTGDGVFAEPGTPSPQNHPEVAYYRGYCREKLGTSGRADFDAASRMPTTYVFPRRAESLAVLRRAVEANPDDATAHFLLGSLYLSGGIADRAVAEWERARQIRPAIPTLHRNLGLTLLHALREPERAKGVLLEGITVDRDNVEVYQALDQVLGLLGRPAAERVRALEAYPHPESLPPSLVFKLALAFLEAGRVPDAERLFPGRFFPREEFGTNIRQVYLEVETQKALGEARRKDCGAARRTVDGLGREVPGLAFTKDGLAPFVDAARTQYLIGEVLDACGDAASARRHREKAASAADVYPYPHLAYAYRAAARLEPVRAEDLRPKLEAAIRSWTNRLAVGTSFPGANACGQGLMLRALGRQAEADAKLREALLLPDKLMSHYLSRAALATGDERVASERRPER